MNPMVRALKELGGSGSVQEIYERTTTLMGLAEELLSAPHAKGDSQSEVAYRMAWARTYLKKAGYLDNSQRGIWTLTSKGQETTRIDERSVVRHVKKGAGHIGPGPAGGDTGEPSSATEDLWREELLSVLRTIEPSQFERLCQRLLRESGFVEVKVLGRTGDGGIDGAGIIRLQGMVSFRVLFQCKRWHTPVGASVVRDFRGAMVGRADRGLLITTASFTRDAQKEATRDGAPPVDLIDGDQLVDLLRQLKLGVETKQVERVSVNPAWFKGI